MLSNPLLRSPDFPPNADSHPMPSICPPALMDIQRHVFDTPGNSDLKMVANRYRMQSYAGEDHGLTLLLTHCIGGHKEQWEPVIESIASTQCTKNRNRRIREVWAFDWQSHGDSAVLNQQILNERHGVSAFEWSLALSSFLRSHHLKGHRVIAVGHSAGAAAIILTTKATRLRELPYCAMILVEPTLATPELFYAHIEDRMALMDFAVSATSVRRNTWNSRADAFRHFTKRLPWASWDPRIVHILTEYGLRDMPSGQVTLKCDRRLEAASYPDVEPHFEGAAQLGRICHLIPIHLIWGTRNDMVPEFLQNSLSDFSEGRAVSSVVKIEDAGHLIVQENPERLANAICNILNTMNLKDDVTKSRL